MKKAKLSGWMNSAQNTRDPILEKLFEGNMRDGGKPPAEGETKLVLPDE